MKWKERRAQSAGSATAEGYSKGVVVNASAVNMQSSNITMF